jgi:hypothetical protein
LSDIKFVSLVPLLSLSDAISSTVSPEDELTMSQMFDPLYQKLSSIDESSLYSILDELNIQSSEDIGYTAAEHENYVSFNPLDFMSEEKDVQNETG